MEYWHRSAELGYDRAQVTLANRYRARNDLDEAIKWYRLADAQGNYHAQTALDDLGVGSAATLKRRAETQAAAEDQAAADETSRKDADRAWRQGLEFLQQEQYDRAIRWLAASAKRGSAGAQYDLALLYQTGKGVELSPNQAAEWLRKAAQQGHTEAQYRLAWMLATGDGVHADRQEAEKWVKLAADAHHVGAEELAKHIKAAYVHGMVYHAQEDYASAARWFRIDAVQGSSRAQYALADLYQNGQGVTQDKA